MLRSLLTVQNLCVSYLSVKDHGHAFPVLDQISVEISRGRTLGIVGESGSGKTTLGRAIMHLVPITSGKIYYADHEIGALEEKDFFPYRKKIQMIFQDPFGSLDPRMTVQQILLEPLRIHFKHFSKAQYQNRIRELLEQVQLPTSALNRHTHEFSGGQRQRIGIARALAVEPELLICDEPVSALDVSIQAKIVNLLKDLQQQLNLTYLFISHDLAIVHHISDAIVVLHHGRTVEQISKHDFCSHPHTPYTQQLIQSVPEIE